MCASSSLAGYNGRLYEISGRNHNNYIQFRYSWQNGDASSGANLAELDAVHSDGQQLTLTFASFSGYTELASITRPDGQIVRFGYDGSGDLTDVCDVGNGNVDNSPNATTVCGDTTHAHHMYYVANGYLMYWADSPRWRMSQGAQGGYVSFQFVPGSNNAVSEVQDDGIVNFTPSDGTGAQIQSGVSTSAYGWHTDTFTYFGSTSCPATNETCLSDTDGHEANWFYDSAGRVTETQAWTGAPNNLWLTTSASWDTDGLNNSDLNETVDARGNATDYAYDANGNTLAEEQPAVNVSVNGAMQNIRALSLYSYDSFNNVTSYCDALYDAAHALSWTVGSAPPSCPTTSGSASSPGPTVYQYYTADTYEPYGRLTDTYTPMGYHQTISYNNSADSGGDYGLPTDVTGTQILQPLDTKTPSRTPHVSLIYDSVGNVACYSRDGGAHWSRVQYDGLNRPVATADADDASLSLSLCSNAAGIAGSHIQTTTTYYSNGRVASTQSPAEYAKGVSTTYTYDADGNKKSQVRHFADTQGITSYWYDGADRLVEVQQPQDSADIYTSPWTTRYLYDLTQGGAVTLSGKSAVSYKAYGNLFKTQEMLPSATSDSNLSYTNGASKMVNAVAADISGAAYDALDRATTKYQFIDDAPQGETFTYDVSSKFGSLPGLLTQHCNALAQAQCGTPNYDALDRQNHIEYNDATPTEDTVYDPDGRVASITSSRFSTQIYTYDADGRALKSIDPSGGGVTGGATTVTHNYYDDGELKSIDVSSNATINGQPFNWGGLGFVDT